MPSNKKENRNLVLNILEHVSWADEFVWVFRIGFDGSGMMGGGGVGDAVGNGTSAGQNSGAAKIVGDKSIGLLFSLFVVGSVAVLL